MTLYRVFHLLDDGAKIAKMEAGEKPKEELSVDEKRRLIQMAKKRGIKPPKRL